MKYTKKDFCMHEICIFPFFSFMKWICKHLCTKHTRIQKKESILLVFYVFVWVFYLLFFIRKQNKGGEIKTKVRPKQRINQNKGEIKPKAAYLACEVGRRSGSHARPDIGTDLPHTTTVSRFSEQLFWEHKNFQF